METHFETIAVTITKQLIPMSLVKIDANVVPTSTIDILIQSLNILGEV